MTKFFVVNGMFRSGTTMIERLLDSQEGGRCFSHLCEMPEILAQTFRIGTKLDLVTDDGLAGLVAGAAPQALKKAILLNLAGYITRFDHSRYGDGQADRLHGLALADYMAVFEALVRRPAVADLRDVLAVFAERGDTRLLGSKWTACHRYAPLFLARPDTYWIEVVRAPLDRYQSARLSHGQPLVQAARHSADNYRFAGSFRHPRYAVLKYEEICADPAAAAGRLGELLGEEVAAVDLKDPHGGAFKPNTSRNELEGRAFFHQDPAASSAIHVNRWDSGLLGRPARAVFAAATAGSPLYQVEGAGLDLVLGRALLAAADTLNGLRRALRARGRAFAMWS